MGETRGMVKMEKMGYLFGLPFLSQKVQSIKNFKKFKTFS